MALTNIVNAVYSELYLTALILLIIMLHNTLFIYRRKLSDYLSIMLIFAIIMCVFELLSEYLDGSPNLIALTYTCCCGYAISFLLFITTLNLFFFKQFNLMPKKKWMYIVFYFIPNIVFILLCITTPWTHLVYWVANDGTWYEMILFRTLFYGLLLFYLFVALMPAIYFAVSSRYKSTKIFHLSISLIKFGILIPAIFLLQIIFIGDPDSYYYTLSLPVAIALTYLTADVNTRLLLESQATIDAVEADLKIASEIQADALPPAKPEFVSHKNISIRALMSTAKEVGGDFYDYFAIDENHICIVISDVSGKGTPAALFMMRTKTMIKDYALTCKDTSEIFNLVNNRLYENNATSTFATAWIGIVNTSTMVLQYTNAGHNYPIIKRHGEKSELIKVNHGLFLAGMKDTKYGQDELELHPGDHLLLYTDGITEAHSMNKTLYSTKRLIKTLDDCEKEDGEDILTYILKDVQDFSKGEPQFDDITMLVLSII
ncbi:MAG: SpoIIE family protein phosphatase [Lachnospiraceae bacterium]|nr:SpoIIE family protein phosphatase [Lachnospiraceae bacterium]